MYDDVYELDENNEIVKDDNGMNTQENKYIITEKGNEYIVSKSVKKSWSKLSDWALNNNNYIEIRNSLGEVFFKYKSRINEIILTYKNEDNTKLIKKVKEKEIIYWSKKHYEKELNQKKKFIEYLESCKEHPNKLKDKQRKSQEFIKTADVDKKTGEIIHPEKIIVFLDKNLKNIKKQWDFILLLHHK